MLDTKKIEQIIEQKIKNSDLFVVDVKIDTSNNISIFLDSDTNVSINQCVDISKHIEDKLNRDEEDFSLEVSSAGIGQAFKKHRQYKKAVGKPISVLLKNGVKLEGELVAVDTDDFEISYQKKEKLDNSKRPKIVTKKEKIKFDAVKTTVELINIK